LQQIQNYRFHRDNIDHLIIQKNGKEFRRIEPVLDCWFESGSMPFASEGLRTAPPQADFIAEGIDQCRGWFYTLLVLGVALFNESPYKTVKVSGLLLGNNGEKMSKNKKNYTEVNTLMEKYSSQMQFDCIYHQYQLLWWKFNYLMINV
jgi:isoleucyl-tRNA synthetase